MVSLIPSAENGLFSRFIFYRIKPNPAFKDVFDHRKSDYDKFFSDLGLHYYQLFELLSSRSVDDPVRFKLSLTQQERFLPFFRTVKDDVRENVGDDMAGSINRLGLICFRICMIVSIIRVYDDTGNVPRLLLCKDVDFDNALLILDTLKRHALSVYWELPKPKLKSGEEIQDETKVVQKRRCRELLEQGLSYRDIATQILGSANKRQTVYRWLNQ